MRILLVEDDEALCAAVAPLLEREGYRVDVCRDGDDALYYKIGRASCRERVSSPV